MGASSRRTLVCGRSVWILTMMQSCALAAKLRAAGPILSVAIIVQEGKLDAILGRDRVPIGPGDTVLAPAGSAHGFLNRYEEPARLLFIFPTHQVEQVEVSIPGATLGFPSEKGLSGYQSPEDRPLGEGR